MFNSARSALARFIAPPRAGQRQFAAAQVGRLYADWVAGATSADTEIRSSYRRIIDRSRSLERDNDYMRGFLGDCQDNIVGAIPHDLTTKAGEFRRDTKGNYILGKDGTPTWAPDKIADFLIFEAWEEWCALGVCTVCHKHTWRDVKNLVVRSVPRDGTAIVRKVTGPAAGNRFGFALQLWEIDHLDLQKFGTTREGNEIRFGVELDAQGAHTAYWLKARHPGDLLGGRPGESTSIRFDGSEIYELFLSERSEQTIGIPWVVSAITRLRQLGAFEEAAVIAARLGASKAGFFETNGKGEYTGETNSDGRAVMVAEPGQFEQLPDGWKMSAWSPEYPNIDTAVFRKAMLMGVATGLRRAYPNFARDLEGVNYSSARVGVIDERETWKGMQLWFTDHFYKPVFADWLEASMLTGAIPLPIGKFKKFNRPKFKARRWPWVDPLKDMTAAATGIALRITSRDEIIEERGGDRDDVFLANLDDQNFAEAIGLDLAPPQIGTANAQLSNDATDLATEEEDPAAKAKPAKAGKS